MSNGFTGHEVATTVTDNAVTYHETEVARIDGDTVTLDSGGWRTVTTKRRMNQASKEWGRGFRVYQEKGEWFVWFCNTPDEDALPFTDGMTFESPPVHWNGDKWTAEPWCDACDRAVHSCGCDKPYRIVRFYQDPWKKKRTVQTRLSLSQAQLHCSNPETSSSTCTTPAARRITRRNGQWFDGYTDR